MSFTNKFRCFWNVCLSRRLIQDPFGEKRGRFDYQGLLARLSATHRRIREKLLAEDERNENDSDSDTSSSGTDPDSQGSSHPWLPGQCWSQKWGQGLKSKATFFLFDLKWRRERKHRKSASSAVWLKVLDSRFCSTNDAARGNVILSWRLNPSTTS